MNPALTIVAGATILTVIGIVSGGAFLLGVLTRQSGFSALQKSFFRAGHAHAGVLVILGLVCILLLDAAGVEGAWAWSSVGILASAILIPSGFFLSVLGSNAHKPGRAISLLWAGVGVLAASLVAVATTLIVTAASAL